MKMFFVLLMALAVTASAQDIDPAQEAEWWHCEDCFYDKYVLTLFPAFVEFVDPFESREACVEKGIEWLTRDEHFDGFLCAPGRAWQKLQSITE
jgi:hypothetical protein